MIRKGFRMVLKPGFREEYKARHDDLWQDLRDVLKSHGVSNYSIFHDERDDSLFGYAEIRNEEEWKAIATTQACRRWWEFMTDIMETNSDNSPRSEALEEVFHLD